MKQKTGFVQHALMLLCVCLLAPSAWAMTVDVVYNSSSGIKNAQYTATLDDGTVLGFQYGSFVGAITTATSLTVPDSLRINGSVEAVISIGYSYGLDLSQAPNLTVLTFPSTVTLVYSLPATISDIHLLGETPPDYRYNIFCRVWVPQSAYTIYQATNWAKCDLVYEGWQPRSVTVSVATAGLLGQQVLSQVDQWTDVEHLTVSGHLNTTDMEYFSKMVHLRRLDLSQTDITTVSGCDGLTRLREVVLPETVATIGSSAFSGCVRLRDINLPETITSIEESGFYNCLHLLSISLPAATTIGGSAFSYCSGLTSISLPAATTIGESAFYDCSGLTSINLPAATTIGGSAFYDCSGLTSISLPAATTIGSDAFRYCSGLMSINLPMAKTIGSSAFGGCSGLTSITLPASLQTLGGSCFHSCSSLKDIYCHVAAPFPTGCFSNSFPSGVTLHVPAFSATAYKLHKDWGYFDRIESMDESVDELKLSSDFAITSFTGLADKASVTVGYDTKNKTAGHLTVSADGAFALSSYAQHLTRYGNSRYYTDYVSTLLANSPLTADAVAVTMTVGTDCWHFISLPFDVNVSDIRVPDDTQWVIRRYSGANRAALSTDTWIDMPSGTTLQAGEGYILQCTDVNNRTGSIEFTFPAADTNNKNNIFATGDVTKALETNASEYTQHRGWNLVGNAYPSYYNTAALTHNGVITVWDGSNYSAYSLTDDQYVLRPFEAFFVQCPTDANSLTFGASGRQHETGDATDNNSMGAPRRSQADRHVLNLVLTNGEYADRTRLVINAKASADYETSCDAAKMMSDELQVPQLYMVDNGIRYAIDERPLGSGMFNLGMRAGSNGSHTLRLQETAPEGMTVMLTDRETGRQTDLSNGEGYTFTASAGICDSRFMLAIGGNVTGIDRMTNDDIRTTNEVYDLQGRRVASPQRGVYITQGRKVVVR